MSAQVKRWLDQYPSEETRRRYEFSLSKFCEFHQVTPTKTLKWSVREAEDRLLDWKAFLTKEERAGSSIKVAFTVIKRWYQFNKIRVDVQCRNVDTGRTYLDYLPTRDDVQRLLDTTKLHHRVIIALMAFSGLRPVDIASLQYRHIKASFEDGDDVLTIIKKQNKTKQWYPTFLGFQGTRYLRSYIQERKDRGDTMKASSPIIVKIERDKDTEVVSYHAVTVHAVTAAVHRAIERTVGKHPTGEDFRLFRPYGLRKYFRRTVGKLGENTAEYLMGHQKGYQSLSATYSGLRDLDPKAINDLKQQYISILGELETEIADVSLKSQIKDMEEVRKAELAAMEENQKIREAELIEIKKDVDEIRGLVRALKEEDEKEQKKTKTKKT